MHRLSKIKIKWNSKFAYAIGLIATDGCLSKDGRHVDFTSKDEELVSKFKDCLNIKNKIGIKYRGKDKYNRTTKYFRIQLGDTNFYEFLISIGLSQRKSKIMGPLDIQTNFFRDFLRGCIDGDGSIGFFMHPESRLPQVRVSLVSASERFLKWIKSEIAHACAIKRGWIYNSGDVHVLCYAKVDSIKLLRFLYKDKNCVCLSRKLDRAKSFMGE